MQRTKATNKFWAFALSLIMLLTLIPFSPISLKASAASGSYVLDVNSLTAGNYAGKTVKAGTDNFFTVKFGDKGKIDTSDKAFDDGYAGKNRLNFGGKTTLGSDAREIEFKTTGAAEVKVWWVSGGDGRFVELYSASKGANVDATKTSVKNALYIDKLNVTEAGTYQVVCAEGTNYIFKIEVTPKAEAKEYVLDVNSLSEGDYAGKNGVKAGTDNYFTINYGSKGKIDKSEKTFDDGYTAKTRINFGGGTTAGSGERDITFKTSGAAEVKVWWVSGGDNRFVELYSASKSAVVDSTKTSAKNALYIDKLNVTEAGTYQIICAEGTNYLFKVQVTEGGYAPVVRGDWSKVSKPVIMSAALNATDKGKIDVTVAADVSANGGDKLTVDMLDEKGNVVETRNSVAEKTSHILTFTPTASGKYKFTSKLVREGETDKVGSEKTFDFVLPLEAPTIVSVTSKGSGKMEIIWQPVDEATGYKVYVDGKEVGTSSTTKFIATGLTVGNKYSFTVAATRAGETGTQSVAVSATATKEEQQTWGFIRYGTSTDDKNNGYVGSINDNNKVTVFSENGKGKIQQGSNDGLAFYYTAIPTTKNFTLRATIHVDSWTYSNGQDGFGMMVADSVPAVASTSPFWTNQYMIVAAQMKYKWDPENKEVSDVGTVSYTQNIGLGINQKIGVTAANVDAVAAGTNPDLVKAICGTQVPLDITLATSGKAAGTYNTVGNEKSGKAPTAPYTNTDFDVEIQKNNTGYFLTYYKDGKVVKTQKYYDPNALSVLDKDNVYVGFFAARNARITVSNVQLTTIDPKDDKPAEAKPKDKVRPSIQIKSGTTSNSENYTLTVTANVKGTAEVTVNGTVVKTFSVNTVNAYTNATIKLADGSNKVVVKFTPDAKQNLGDKELASTAPVSAEIAVAYNNYFAEQKNLYVSPNGTKYGNGGPQYPLDVYTAVSVAQPGQTIVVMEGTYKLSNSIIINRGADGTKDKPIYMVADPNAKTRPVFDFQHKGGTSVAGLAAAGDYWYFKGFDVANTKDKLPGFMVSGSNCVVDSVNTYGNGDTGLYIRAFNNSSDPKSEWPANNLILNCTSYNNADKGYEDADGFAAKFTVGAGNVFDGCISHHNADDGWDLYARVSSGRIEPVTIQNCVAYKNGYLLDGTKAGNGNGFKLGGESLAGGHIIKNSIAFENKLNGITSNSCPDVKVYNCTSYNNEAANLTLYTGIASASTDFEVKGLISYKGGAADSVKAQGSQSTSKYESTTNHYDGNGVTDAWFKSLKFKGEVARKANGTIDMEGYLELTDNAAKDAGARMTGTASGSVTIKADDKLPNPITGVAAIPVAALAIAGAALFVVSRKRRSR